MGAQPAPQEHLTDEQLAAYVGGSMSIDERKAAVGHLVACARCRDEVLAAARALRTERTRRSRYIGAPVATAAALGAALLILVPRSPIDSPGRILREGTSALAPAATIEVFSPPDSAGRDEIEFSWRDMGAEIRYRFHLTRSDGEIVWSDVMMATTMVLPPEVKLSEGTTYFWWVDALLLDGRSVTTEVQSVTIVP